MYRLLAFVIGYAFGNIPSGYLMGKAKKVDITRQGSGNIGTTNTLRVLGNLPGALCLVFDCLKGVIPALIIRQLTKGSDLSAVYAFYAAFGAVIGHDFPLTMKLHGGKGIATSLGLFIVSYPVIVLPQLLVFIMAVSITRYVSLGSILCAATFPFMASIAIMTGHSIFSVSDAPEIVILSFAVGILAIVRHRSNIKRLLDHSENKFSFHHRNKEDR
ncbi:MAG: glycerol-3-phosphate 1-O-acyltransferase PlsY [Lachnospiraceae bacterium]|nr:glycerol-3-phosphate 1-O-acyltransferase PlsY [Lachnospiraceae bacterium]